MHDQLLETWRIHNRINLYLLESIPDEALEAVAASKGRNVAEQFAHIHKVRLMWLKASAPESVEGSIELPKGDPLDKPLLSRALTHSAEQIETMLLEGLRMNRIKNFKPHPTAFLGYIISHESHHRGQIMMTLKEAGFPADKKTGYGIWEWGAR